MRGYIVEFCSCYTSSKRIDGGVLHTVIYGNAHEYADHRLMCSTAAELENKIYPGADEWDFPVDYV